MASTFPGYEYDIFISYRQKDNKYDGWVSEFVTNLKKELEATSKEDISVFFDINPHDGLLESHDVDESLKEKLKCLIFIPIISRTYCDPKSFAWEHEFKAFVDIASMDTFGLKVRLPGGNVASRILPVRIYDLNKEDIQLCESVMGGTLRGIEFIYKSAGVNRPLRANEDHANENLNKTYYRDQINKLAHSIHEILDGLRINSIPGTDENDKQQSHLTQAAVKNGRSIIQSNINGPERRVLLYLMLILILISSVFAIKHLIFNKEVYKGATSEEVLNKAIRIIDPSDDWSSRYDGKIRVRYINMNAESENNYIVEIDNQKGFWRSCSANQKNGFCVKNGKYYRFVVSDNNNSEVDSIVKDSTVLDWVRRDRRHDYCLFGILMELKGSGLILDKHIIRKKFQGYNCLALKFNSKDSKVMDHYFEGVNCTIFLDQLDYSLKGYKFEDPKKNADYYCILAGTVVVNDQFIPICRTYYSSSDNSFIGIDIITPAN
jgi:hypothetical protein